MSEKAGNPVGPTGARVASAVKALREARGMSYRDLADALERLGRTIPTLGLSRIERHERRVDSDDLVALALALGVTPDRLMMPPTASSRRDAALTPSVTVHESGAWGWATGEAPPALSTEDALLSGTAIVDREEFRETTRPDRPVHQVTMAQVHDHAKALDELRRAADRIGRRRGVPDEVMSAYLEFLSRALHAEETEHAEGAV